MKNHVTGLTDGYVVVNTSDVHISCSTYGKVSAVEASIIYQNTVTYKGHPVEQWLLVVCFIGAFLANLVARTFFND